MKSVIIVGGGISGLTAGVYLQKYGYSTTIVEKNPQIGGECTGWDRKGFHLDNCLHWMTGSSPLKPMHDIWCETGALDKDETKVPMYRREIFHRHLFDGEEILMYNDPEKLRAHLKELFPVDAKAIDTHIDLVKDYAKGESMPMKPLEQMGLKDLKEIGKLMFPLLKHHPRYSKMSLEDYANRFKSPALRHLFTSYLPKEHFAESMLFMYGIVSAGDGDIPRGGSLATAQRMRERYESLGGTIISGNPVLKFSFSPSNKRRTKGRVTAVELANGDILRADAFVAACDPSVTFNTLLPVTIKDKYFEQRYSNPEDYPVHSNFIIYLDVPMESVNPDIDITTMNGECSESYIVKHFANEPGFAPEGRTVLQILIDQDAEQYEKWERLYKYDHDNYVREKSELAARVMQDISLRLGIKDCNVLDILTPYSMNRWCGAYKGSYMAFISSADVPLKYHNGRVKGINNLVLAGSWLMPPGGTPCAAVAGKYAADRLRKLCKD